MILCREAHAKTLTRRSFRASRAGRSSTSSPEGGGPEGGARARFKEYQRRIVENAVVLAEGLKRAGLRLVSAAPTTTHAARPQAEEAHREGGRGGAGQGRDHREQEHDPWDPEKPMTTSGIRVGTPALTTRGMGAREMTIVSTLIGRVLDAPGDEQVLSRVRGEVKELCAHFPMYADRQ